MIKNVPMQPYTRSEMDRSKLCSFDFEVETEPTSPLIHKDARFLYIKNGDGLLALQGRRMRLQRGTLVSILPWQVSEIVQVKVPLQYALIAYHLDTVEHAARLFREQEDQSMPIQALIEQSPSVQLNDRQQEEMDGIAEALQEELGLESMLETKERLPFSGTRVVSLLVQLLVLYCRAAADQPSAPLLGDVDGSQILRYMYLHCGEKLTLQTLAELFYLSRSTVSARITKLTGLSFFDLLNEMRIGKTINYLLYTDLTLKEMAEFLGYVDESHISKVFAARIGSRAAEFRETYRRIQNICQIEESRKAYTVINAIYRHYDEELSAKSVAQEFGLTVAQLNHLLLCQTEHSFEEFLNLIRINRACELLAVSSKSLVDIACEVGYHNAKTFSRNFLRFRTMTPGEYRAKIQEEDKQSKRGSKNQNCLS